MASDLRQLAASARARRCGRRGDLEDLGRTARCLISAAALIDQARATTAIALARIPRTNVETPTPAPQTPAITPTPRRPDSTAGWLVLQAAPLASGTTEHTLLGAASNPRLAFADARRRCEAAGCTLPGNAHAAPSDPAAISTALALLERPGAVQRLAREPVITATGTAFLRGAPCQDCAGLEVPDCPSCSGSGFETAEIDAIPENDVALVVGPRWAPLPDNPHHYAHGRPVLPPCPDCGGDIEWNDYQGRFDTGRGFRPATIAEIDQALRQLPLFGVADSGGAVRPKNETDTD
ncbi:MAG: hypothetical protein OXI15_02235 [Chromatiales bacterium]|nr:hypothetical protein [Chromatiales bacterium]